MCKRGSCGVRGRFEKLAQRFGERAEIIRPAARAKKQFVLPDAVILPPSEEITAYFARRKISSATLDSRANPATGRARLPDSFF